MPVRKWLVGLVVAVTWLVAFGTANAEVFYWSTGEGANGHGYEPIAVPIGISWTDARDAAANAGGHLATHLRFCRLGLSIAARRNPERKELSHLQPAETRFGADNTQPARTFATRNTQGLSTVLGE